MSEGTKGGGKTDDGVETVLVVEDGAAVRKAVGFILRKNGYRVLEAVDARQALKVIREDPGPVHLLLTDVMMPEISGPELVGMLGADRPEMKVLYVSGHADRDVMTQEVITRGQAFLRKPFAMDELLAKVREVLHGDPGGD